MMQSTDTIRRNIDPGTGPHTIELPVVCETLDCWLAYPWNRGVQIDELEDLHALRVQTRNSTYELVIIASDPGQVLVRGGRYFPEWTRVHLAGCSFGGALLKRYGIHPGLRLELYWQGRRVLTSPICAITHVETAMAASAAC